jgi:hypothetical protein
MSDRGSPSDSPRWPKGASRSELVLNRGALGGDRTDYPRHEAMTAKAIPARERISAFAGGACCPTGRESSRCNKRGCVPRSAGAPFTAST